jgi:hypothetical protein
MCKSTFPSTDHFAKFFVVSFVIGDGVEGLRSNVHEKDTLLAWVYMYRTVCTDNYAEQRCVES